MNPFPLADSDTLLFCPHCETSLEGRSQGCRQCGADLDWLRSAPVLRDILLSRGPSEEPLTPSGKQPVPVTPVLPNGANPWQEIHLPTARQPTITLGRRQGQPHAIVLPDPQVDMTHAALTWQWATQTCWIADNGSRTGTFVNGRPILLHPLQGGDLIQIGPCAWTFNALDRVLVQVGPIEGVRLECRDVSVGRRLRNVSFQIRPGEFVALVGPSGAGKSTLIHALMGDPRAPYQGRVLAEGHDVRQQRDWFRAQLGYVAQQDALHADLPAEEAVKFAARLRGTSADSVLQVLKEVDFPMDRRRGLCRELSGGESKRLRLAAELMAHPRLLILDEPGSGLDEGRETEMMRLMRQWARRGGTVIMITHHLRQLKYCDRVLAVVNGELAFNGPPQELPARMPSGNFAELEKDQADNISPATGSVSETREPVPIQAPNKWSRLVRQFAQVLRRDVTLLWGERTILRRVLLPVLLLPTFFAVSIGGSVPGTDLSLLGFLAILACIWMGSSLSLMAIVDEREAYDHERLLGLRIVPYVAAKLTLLGILAVLQSLLFLGLLSVLRSIMFPDRADAMLLAPMWSAACLSLVSLAAAGLGLVISACAGRSRPTANFILPLVMMAQIVFSVQVAGESDADLHVAYQNFRLNRDRDNTTKPLPTLVTVASHVTLSRYGDITLRSFAYHQRAYEAFRKPVSSTGTENIAAKPELGYPAWRQQALAVLCLAAIAFPVLAALILWWQEQRWFLWPIFMRR